MAWIAEVDTDLVVWLMESLAGNPGPTNLIYDLVIKADQTSVERDLKTLGVAMAGYDLGVPVERHLIDIMRRLVREGVWLINLPGARLWNMDGHVYLVWPAAGEELARQIKEDGIPGIPRTPDGILDMLTDRGMAFLREEASPEERLWKIAPAVLAEKIPDIKLTAIRLRDEAMVSSVPLPSAPGRVIATAHTGDTKPETNVPMQQPNDSKFSAEASSVAIPAQAAPDPSHPEHTKLAIVVGTKAMGTTDSVVSAPIQLSGAIGEALKALAQDLKANDKKLGHDAILSQEGHVFLRWPDAFSGYGLAPKIVLDQLTERGWLVIDPMSPLKRTIPQNFEDGAHNAVHLNLDISKVFLAHSGWSGSVRKPDIEAAQGHLQPVSAGGSVTREKKKTTPIGAASSKPAGLPDDELVNAGRASSKSIPTIDAMLTILRTLNVVPHDDGYCRVGKTEGLKLCKAAGLKVNHRILWTFDEMKSELLALEDGQIKFKP
jgi:conjugal transfer pilus assembly protein TraI